MIFRRPLFQVLQHLFKPQCPPKKSRIITYNFDISKLSDPLSSISLAIPPYLKVYSIIAIKVSSTIALKVSSTIALKVSSSIPLKVSSAIALNLV